MLIPLRPLGECAGLPVAAHPGDSGHDLRSRLGVVLPPGGGRAAVPVGVAVAIPAGYGGFVLPRSSLARHHGVTCLNAPGLVDSGYRGEIEVVLVNLDPVTPFAVEPGDRIAQLVILRTEPVEWSVVTELPASSRGTGGFGSTGRR